MLRVPGWPTAAAAAYAAAGHAGGVALLLSPPPPSYGAASALLRLAGAVALLSHARVVAAVLVHDATHDAVFARGWRNAVAGTALLWLAGTPYCYFPHVQKARNVERTRASRSRVPDLLRVAFRCMWRTIVTAQTQSSLITAPSCLASDCSGLRCLRRSGHSSQPRSC